jgi:hypothetical protein
MLLFIVATIVAHMIAMNGTTCAAVGYAHGVEHNLPSNLCFQKKVRRPAIPLTFTRVSGREALSTPGHKFVPGFVALDQPLALQQCGIYL